MTLALEAKPKGRFVPGLAPAREELRWLLKNCRAPRIRTMRRFAEEEVIIPEGPFKGRRFKVARQPFTGLWLDAVDSGRWQRHATTGPSQSGKTMLTTMVPLLYHLFEIGETVGFALPDMDMADDKWRKDIRPIVERTRFRELLPSEGEGARGGKVKNMVVFRNGSSLKFFSAGGGDKGRAGFTTRVLIVTEADAFGTSGETSEEANKLEQLVARTKSFGKQARIYLECTVTVEQGIIWSEYRQGSESRIACPCPRCEAWVSPERAHLVGWQDATSVVEARTLGHFVCPNCEGKLADEDRRQMNERAVLVHRGQEVKTGELDGDAPATETLGFRWSGFNNLFLTAGDLAVDEWNAARSTDEDSAERKMCQFVWCVPFKGQVEESLTLSANELMARMGPWARGLVPADTFALTCGVDLGKRLAHYVVIAWTEDGRGHVVDYSRFEIAADELGGERAILLALRDFRDRVIMPGFPLENSAAKWVPDQVWIDARYQGGERGDSAVYQFVSDRESEHERWRPIFGFGAGTWRAERYRKPSALSKTVIAIGEGYHFTRDLAAGVVRVEIDSDHWKSWFHARLSSPLANPDGVRLPGSMTLPRVAMPKEHTAIAKHWAAEKQIQEFVPGRGVVIRWENERRRPNHFLDASMIASSAGHFCGVRLVEERGQGQQQGLGTGGSGRGEAEESKLTTPDGRPYFVLER